MCGIFGIFNYEHINYSTKKLNKKTLPEFISTVFNNASHRGPDNSVLINDSVSHSFLGFHRLTINGSNHYYGSNQPIYKNDIILLCNGEIYNYHTLLNELDLTKAEKDKHSGSDCEIIIDLYLKYGMDTTLELLDGVFAFILMDMRCLSSETEKTPKIYIARDPFGLRPLYWLKHNNDIFNGHYPELVGTCLPFGFASEMKQLAPFVQETNQTQQESYLTVEPFSPGHYVCYEGHLASNDHHYLQKDAKTFDKKVSWFIQPSSIKIVKYFTYPHMRSLNHVSHNDPVSKIKDYLINAVEKRIHCTDRPIACLLSGGVDSSLVCGIIRQLLPKDKPLETYSIGMAGASDKEHIEKVAKFINSNHTHVELPKEDFLTAIPEVIRLVETYDTTTVRASVGNYLIAKYISENSDAKVIFNGDGSDELFGGYKYFLNCPNKYEFNKERKRLLNDIHYFDVLRSERSISVNGLEARTPFLDKELVSYVMTLCHDLTFTNKNSTKNEKDSKYLFNEDYKSCVFEAMKASGIEKWMLRRAFITSNIIPESILTRSKEAFSDGVSSEEDSWYLTIQKHIIKTFYENMISNRVGDDKSFFYDEFLLPENIFINLYEQENNKNDTKKENISYINIDELYEEYDLETCYKALFKNDSKVQINDSIKNNMLNIEKWYYRKVYNYHYYPVNTIPYYWMPKFSNETVDPSARTLNVYSQKHNEMSEEEKNKYNFDKIMLNNIVKIDFSACHC